MSEKIVSKSNSKIKYLTSLHNVKYRKENKQFLAEGYKSLEMALKAGLVKEVYSLKEISCLKDIPNYIVSEEIMEKI